LVTGSEAFAEKIGSNELELKKVGQDRSVEKVR
jgi:hypothetical protein